MTPTKTTLYPTGHEVHLTARDVKLILRIRQLARQQHNERVIIQVIVDADGTYNLVPPPPAAERIG